MVMSNVLDPCVLCGMPIKPQANGWAGGHNAQPIKEGQCCDVCHPLVITKRMLDSVGFNKEGEVSD